MKLQRSSGVVLHPTSLPSGTLGADAYAFVDWLAAAGQRWWQVLPLGPGDETGSPYASASAFAGNPGLLADPEAPVDEAEAAAFRERNAYWIDDWERHEHGGEHAAHERRRARDERAQRPAHVAAILGAHSASCSSRPRMSAIGVAVRWMSVTV